MRNRFFLIIFIIIFFLNFSESKTKEPFNFDVTQIEIYENGNKFKGVKRGLITTNDGINIIADTFVYDKKLNLINLYGDIIFEDKFNNYLIKAEIASYDREAELITTTGDTSALIEEKYLFNSSNLIFFRNEMKLISNEKSTVEDKDNIYQLKNFIYFLNQDLLKGNNIDITTNHLTENSDYYNFSSGIINLKTKNFQSKDVKVNLHKKLFDSERKDNANNLVFNSKNDPRIYGVSASGDANKTIINKGIFTSCGFNDDCPPWSIKSNKIIHDKIKKQMIYDNAFLNIYDVPVLYFPKFFHPDPTIKRQSGFLQPRLNQSNVLGSSLSLPYYKVISDTQDLTLRPTIFNGEVKMFQNEYREVGKDYSLIVDFGLVDGYKSLGSNNKNSLTHIFSKFNKEINLNESSSATLEVNIEKTSNDTYLKIFENNFFYDDSLKNNFSDLNTLTSSMELTLNNDDYYLTSGMRIYENLNQKSSDRFQYQIPYYEFSKNYFPNYDGIVNFNSNGNNTLSNTNNLKTNIINNINFRSFDSYKKNGFVNNFGVYLKNLNSLAKNDSVYKSSPQLELLNIYELYSEYPLVKSDLNFTQTLIPKISFRINPTDMKNYRNENRLITTDNLFSIDRLGLSDTFEAGKSITLGLDYKKNSVDSDKYIEFKLGNVFRDAAGANIPQSSSINQKTSNLFGSIDYKYSENYNFEYDFSIDNDLSSIEYNSVTTSFSINNFITEFNYLEKNKKIGAVNTIENTSKLTLDEHNSLSFKTRRNREISLTEYYDLVYEFQNDCLSAAIKYNKTYYQDRDFKPKEDLFFTITLFPLSTFEQKVDQNLYRNN